MIRVQHLSKQFGDLQVLKDISTEIRKGEVIAVIGPSGSGKSTFLRCLNLLEKPSSGDVLIDGLSLTDRHTQVAKLRQRMGMVFQSFNLWPHLSVRENLTLGPMKLLGHNRLEAEIRSNGLLRLVGLAEKADCYPDELSGGQKQRVAIARCLAMEPEILLFDEPTSALDPTMVSEVLAVIRRLSREGMTMIIVTHEMKFARDTASRVFYMDEGRIYEEGRPEDIFDHPQGRKTKEFINQIRSVQFLIKSKDYDLYALHGEIEQFCEKHMLGRGVMAHIQLVAEEVLGLMPEISGVLLHLSYSEKEADILLRCESQGEVFNPLTDGDQEDDLGIRLIQGRCKKIDFRHEAGKNILLLEIHDPDH